MSARLHPLTKRNTLVNGSSARRWPAYRWEALKIERAWVDPGPSPAGNLGPYLKAPFVCPEEGWGEEEEVVYRLYPADARGKPERDSDGRWCWRYA